MMDRLAAYLSRTPFIVSWYVLSIGAEYARAVSIMHGVLGASRIAHNGRRFAASGLYRTASERATGYRAFATSPTLKKES